MYERPFWEVKQEPGQGNTVKCQKIIFVGLYGAMDASRERSSPCRRRRQEMGINNPSLHKEDFDLEEGGVIKRPSVLVLWNEIMNFPISG